MTKKKKKEEVKAEELQETVVEEMVKEIEAPAEEIKEEPKVEVKEEPKVEVKEEPKAQPKKAGKNLKIGEHELTDREALVVEELARVHHKVKTPWIPHKKLTQEKLDLILKDHTFTTKLGELKSKLPKK